MSLEISLLLGLLLPLGTGDPVIFADDFESGDANAWSTVVGLAGPPECVVGPVPSSVLEGDLGTAPVGGTEIACLEIRNDRAFARAVETAFSGVPIPRALDLRDADLDRLLVIGPGNRRLPAQFDVLSRWGGPLDEVTLPIRWLAISIQAPIDAAGATDAASIASLRLLATAPGTAADPYAVTITPTTRGTAGGHLVDTGVATFTLDPADPALVTRIEVDLDDDGSGRQLAYTAEPGAGPRLVFDPGGGPIALDTATAGRVVVAPGGFEIVEAGPVKAVVVSRGHFVAPGGASLCAATNPAYERFGYTAVATFHRGRRDVDLRFHVRNECSDAFGADWYDEAIEVDEAAWRWTFGGVFGTSTAHHAGAGTVASSAVVGASTPEVVVEQRKGAGTPWQRRARVTRDGTPLETATTFDEPFVALEDSTFLAAVHVPFLRYREPQAVATVGESLDARVVSETLRLGEGKGIWSVHRLSLLPRALATPTPAAWLDDVRERGLAAVERGLLVRADRDAFDAAGLYPALGDPGSISPPEQYYLDTIGFLHQETVRPGGQWDRNRIYGSQLWPDIPLDQFSTAPTPFAHDAKCNYWNPFGAELWEFLRGGDPAFAWDFALPLAWHQAFAAYLNLGEQAHGNRNGFTVAGAGTGEGHWNRAGELSSDDYNYNLGMQLAYALRPEPTMRHRFDQAGRTVVERYVRPKSEEALRDPFVDAVDLARQRTQHFEHLANCAEFSPGQRGRDCHAKLMEIVAELTSDNAASGVFCGGDIPNAGQPCSTPQQFMMNAHIYYFFQRVEANYGATAPWGPTLRRALVEAPRAFYTWGIPKEVDGTSIDTGQAWPNGLDCTLTGDGSSVVSCAGWTGGDPTFFENYPHTLALLLVAHQLDPSIGLCEIAKQAMDEVVAARAIDGYLSNGAGWFKGSSQVMQGLVFGVGGYELCSDP